MHLRVCVRMCPRADPHASQGFIFVSMSPGHVDTDMGHLPAPGRPKPTLSVADSVSGMIAVLERLTTEDNGSFHKFNGDVLPW